jgi:hypothetical protein
MVVEVKDSLETQNSNTKGYQLNGKVNQLDQELVLISKNAINNHGYRTRKKFKLHFTLL